MSLPPPRLRLLLLRRRHAFRPILAINHSRLILRRCRSAFHPILPTNPSHLLLLHISRSNLPTDRIRLLLQEICQRKGLERCIVI